MPAKSVAEFVDHAKKHPNKLSLGSGGNGTIPHLGGELFKQRAGIAFTHVPYKGGAQAMADLIAGQLDFTIDGGAHVVSQIDAGKVRMLAIAADQRSKQFPEVPTLKEAGLNYPGQGWWGLAAPKGTPAAIVEKVNAAFVSVFSDPRFAEFLDKQLVVPAPTSPAAFAAFLKEDRKAAEALVKIANEPRKEYKPQ